MLQVTAALCAAGSVVADCELLSLRRHFGPDGFLSADRLFARGSAAAAAGRPGAAGAAGLLRRFRISGRLGRLAGLVLLCVAVRLISSLLILVCVATGRSMLPGVVGYVVTACLLGARGNLGSNGSDQLFSLTMIAVLVGLVGGAARHQTAALLFVASQLSLAYATASLVKFSERELAERPGTAQADADGGVWRSHGGAVS